MAEHCAEDTDSKEVRVASIGPRSEERGYNYFPSGPILIFLLQWGRAPRSADTSPMPQGGLSPVSASMGPRSEERGYIASGIQSALQRSLQWGRAPRSADTFFPSPSTTPSQPASMGPRSEERGYVASGAWFSPPDRRFNGAALRGARILPSFILGDNKPTNASMGPRSEERGYSSEFGAYATKKTASMGPRSEERGYPKTAQDTVPQQSSFNGAALRGARIRQLLKLLKRRRILKRFRAGLEAG